MAEQIGVDAGIVALFAFVVWRISTQLKCPCCQTSLWPKKQYRRDTLALWTRLQDLRAALHLVSTAQVARWVIDGTASEETAAAPIPWPNTAQLLSDYVAR